MISQKPLHCTTAVRKGLANGPLTVTASDEVPTNTISITSRPKLTTSQVATMPLKARSSCATTPPGCAHCTMTHTEQSNKAVLKSIPEMGNHIYLQICTHP